MNSQAESERQQRLLEALLAAEADAGTLPVRERDTRALRGLQAYRANADASAARALATALPTVQMLVGEDDFALLARAFWRAAPPQRGDLGEWGEGFAAFVEADARLAEWPYLADCARLDWALHCCERAADNRFDADSIARLGDTDPSRLVLELAPGIAVIASPWPIAMVHAAHRSEDPRAFDAVRQAIGQRQGEAVVVAREGWKALPRVVHCATASWMQAVAQGATLADALAQAAEGFDFGAWLSTALSSGWVKGIRVLPD